MSKNVEKINIDEYARFASLLEGIDRFVKKHQVVSYIEFDYYVVHDMTLFSIEPDFDFDKLDKMIQYVKKSTPAMKRIFSKPIIVLKDSDDVLPVENTRIINQNTLQHLANHGQYVSNITASGVKPRKLLTRIYEDDYSIYENVIFCNYVDEILSLIKKNRRTLNSLLYASNIMRFNLLEKVNHLNYFLALGKLHTGYIRDFSQYFNMSKDMLSELSFISQVINPRLHKPVYQKNLTRNKNLSLKKTNIFLMQKDYRLVYKTYKYLLGYQVKPEISETTVDFEQMRINYLMYVQILTIFSVGHFNFEIDPLYKINLDSLDVSFTFKGWKLEIFSNNKKEILLHFTKDKTYKMMLISSDNDVKTFNNYKKTYGVNEVIAVNQYDEEYLERNDVYVSIQDIDSFRRIQQIILKGMIYSDTKRDICPFCGGKLHKEPYQGYYQCNHCMTQIKESSCLETKKPYFYTDIAHLKKYVIHKSNFKHDEYWYYEKQVESIMYFRNITKINKNGDIICPYCNKIHVS
ncbi:MAG: hypothetical protein RBT45_03250 [Acholeplasmataceae bacterium]|jgi:ribosomal protein L37AE/L43A|nr:hypothetical protein [Acholeplasmataceae bacterium]